MNYSKSDSKLLAQHQRGYQKHPVTDREFLIWEDEQVWIRTYGKNNMNFTELSEPEKRDYSPNVIEA